MKRKVQFRYVLPVLTAVAALSLSGVALAADPGQSSSSQPGQQMGSDQSSQSSESSSRETKRLSGTIKAIDRSAGTITVKGTLLSKTLSADASTLQRLSVGQKVDVSYTEQGDKLVATQIEPSSQSSSGSEAQPSSESPSRSPNRYP